MLAVSGTFSYLNGSDLPLFQALLGSGEQFGVPFPMPLKSPGRTGDKLYDGAKSSKAVRRRLFWVIISSSVTVCQKFALKCFRSHGGRDVFAYRVADPERYGVIGLTRPARQPHQKSESA